MLLAELVDDSTLRLQEAVDRSDVLVEILVAILHTYGIPVERVLEEFVLQSAVVAHQVASPLPEVVEYEVGLTRLEHRADEATSPVDEKLRAIQKRKLNREASLLVEVGMDIHLLVRIDVLIAEVEGLQLLELLRHILNPAHDGHGVRLVACVHEALTSIFRGIVRQEAGGNHGVCGLLAANLNRARTFLVFTHHDLQLVVAVGHKDGSLASLLVHVALFVVPELAVVDGAVVEEGYLPVAVIVAPVGGEQLFPALLHRLDALDLESALSVALDKVE